MSSLDYDVAIAGGGHSGAQVALALRQIGFVGSIGILGEETELPYERPALSKEYLLGSKDWNSLLVRPREAWSERNIDLNLGSKVMAVDSREKRLTLNDGRSVGYGALVWAAGGAPRRLKCAGQASKGVHVVRTRADVDQLLRELPMVDDTVVIGGGYIGLEAAAVMRKLGKQVTTVVNKDRVLSRVAGETLSDFLQQEHRAQGVRIELAASVERILEESGETRGVQLTDGRTIPAEVVIVGIGIAPSVGPLLEAGAVGENGVRVDEFCRTSLPDVYAVGDCAEHSNRWADGAHIRLESVQNANDMALTAAKAICGVPQPYAAIPWFWSNQFDLRLQTVGLSRGHDAYIVRGQPSDRKFSIIYLRNNKVIALDCINAPGDFLHGKLLVSGRHRVSDRHALSDPSVPLKSFATSPEFSRELS